MVINAVVNVPLCPLLSQPAEDGTRTDEALYGMPLEILELPEPGWCKVKTHYSYTGFVRAQELLIGPAAGDWPGQEKRVVLRRNFCDVLAQPRYQSPVLLTLPRGCLVRPDGPEQAGWQPLRLWDGQPGWARAGLLDTYYDAPPPIGEAALRQRLKETGLLYAGAQYRWGGKTPLGIDCSGLTSMIYLLNGIVIWRDAQLKEGWPVREIPTGQVRTGDLLYFPGHTAMYLEDGLYLHSTGAAGGDGVTMNSLNPASPLYRADLADRLLHAGSVFPLPHGKRDFPPV